ncbi:hypothetical protein V6Z12_A07G178200 [Gossypium hirsutum]
MNSEYGCWVRSVDYRVLREIDCCWLIFLERNSGWRVKVVGQPEMTLLVCYGWMSSWENSILVCSGVG